MNGYKNEVKQTTVWKSDTSTMAHGHVTGPTSDPGYKYKRSIPAVKVYSLLNRITRPERGYTLAVLLAATVSTLSKSLKLFHNS